MTGRRLSHRWALWVFAAALLLKAAMPLLATASAHLQGLALAEVCPVYGVEMPSGAGPQHEASGAHEGHDHGGHHHHHAGMPEQHAGPVHPASHHDPTASHDGDHCNLTALAALAALADTWPAGAGAVQRTEAQASGQTPALGHDPVAAWIAGRKQGPPDSA